MLTGSGCHYYHFRNKYRYRVKEHNCFYTANEDFYAKI